METVPREIMIEALGDDRSSADLRRALEEALSGHEGVRLQDRSERSPFRLASAIVVAMITGGVSVLTTLITAIATVMSARKKQDPGTIRIETAQGKRLEIPANTPPEKVGEFVAALEDDVPRRILLLEDL